LAVLTPRHAQGRTGLPDPLDVQLVKPLVAETDGLALFAMVRDEDYLLPFFFDHYRKLGIERFVIYDDRSTGFTADFLRAQPDCAILTSSHHYAEVMGSDRFGRPQRFHEALKEKVPERLFPDQWVLSVDADEFLVMPSRFGDLHAFIEHLDSIGQPYATAPMVDFYGETLSARNYDPSVDPFTANPYFDVGSYYYWTGALYPAVFGAGLRHRLLRMLCEREVERVNAIYGDSIPSSPSCWKAPLLKSGGGVRRISTHEIDPPPRGTVSAAIAHFKFHPDLDAKAARALKEGQYFSGSAEYSVLEAAIAAFDEESLIGPETRRFEGPESLEAAGLITIPQRRR
jgi:hypothetical protein